MPDGAEVTLRRAGGPPAWIFFDLGGVFYQLDYPAVWESFSRVSGRTVEQVRDALYGGGLIESFESGSLDSRGYRARVQARLGCSIPFDRFVEMWNLLLVRRAEMFEVAGRLRGEAGAAVVSNTNPLAAPRIERDLGGLADVRVYSFEVGCMKPRPAIFREALRITGAAPEHSLFVDDLRENVEAASALGFATHLFVDTGGFVRVLRSYGITSL